ncbi:MAG: dihydropteroate synthase [Euryarchaeota archaeon]|nr:dihydropteroate synthase [Euryarchaeota archaeon]
MTTNSNIQNFLQELRTIAKANRVELLGILNTTPDSFFDGGKNHSPKSAIESGLQMIRDGAFILDIGGQSSRPGAPSISANEEWSRVEPVIEGILKVHPQAFISIDTYRSEVARKAVDAGAVMVNDISAGSIDGNMFRTVAELQVPYILMHMQGTPETMQENPEYEDVVAEVKSFFRDKLKELESHGIEDVVLDLGFGFGKTQEHNFELLRRMGEFTTFEKPILAGVSRKSMIYKTLDSTPAEALNGTTALNMISAVNGACLLRVHDIAEAREVSILHNHICK